MNTQRTRAGLAALLLSLILAACTDSEAPGTAISVDDRGVIEGVAMRYAATVTVLGNGQVLITGGRSRSPVGAIEEHRDALLLDLARNRIVPAGVMSRPRAGHTATLLDDGQVLIVGAGTADLWSPLERRLHPVAGEFPIADGHSAALLADGRVLITGGLSESDGGSQSRLSGAFIYDPDFEVVRPTGSMSGGRSGHTTIALEDGDALVFGRGTVDRYDSESERFTRLDVAIPAHASATPMGDGRVLLIGGYAADEVRAVASILVFDPASEATTAITDLEVARVAHRAVRLRDGRVLVLGGATDLTHEQQPIASVEVVDASTGSVQALPPLDFSEYPQGTVALADGRVLVIGSGRTGDPFGEVYEVPPRGG